MNDTGLPDGDDVQNIQPAATSPSSCAIDMLSSDILRNIIEWLEYDPADPFRFFMTSRRYHNLLQPHFSIPRRISVVLASSDDNNNEQQQEEAIDDERRQEALGGPFYMSNVVDGKVMRDSDCILSETGYVFFQYNRQRQDRLHLGRHIQIDRHELGVALFRPGELEQVWTIHLVSDQEEEEDEDTAGEQQQQQVEEEETPTLRPLPLDTNPLVKLSVTGTNRERLYRNDPDYPSQGFLHCHPRLPTRNRNANGDVQPPHAAPSYLWSVKNPPEDDLVRVRRTATAFRLWVETSRRQETPLPPRPVPPLKRSDVFLHPKAVFNYQGTVCLYDPASVEELHLTSRSLRHLGVDVKVPLSIWIKDSHCCAHAVGALPFKIAIPICKIDKMDETCTAKTFLASLYDTRSARSDYIIYYCAVAADAMNGIGRPLQSMRSHRLTHPQHSQREEGADSEGANHWFYLVNGEEEFEPSVPDQPPIPSQPWYATVGP